MRSAPDKAEVYSRAGGARLRERERACRFWACFARRGLFWACFSPATDDENCDAPEGAPHEVSRGAYAGEDVWRACVGCTCMAEQRDHAAQGRAEQVGPAQGKWHRAGSASGLQRRSG